MTLRCEQSRKKARSLFESQVLRVLGVRPNHGLVLTHALTQVLKGLPKQPQGLECLNI